MNHIELTPADRADAAVQLRVPMSGIPELDAMIREARRLDAAEQIAAAMVSSIDSEDNYDRLRSHALSLGMKVSQWIANDAIKQSDALLAASEPKKAEPHQWDSDGERCLKCGDKDWMAGPTCSGSSKTPQPGAEGWIEWHGGECPVHPTTLVTVKLRCGLLDTCTADLCEWRHDGTDQDIIAYRVVK